MENVKQKYTRRSLKWAIVWCVIIAIVLTWCGIGFEVSDEVAMGLFQFGVILALVISILPFYCCANTAIEEAYNEGVTEGKALKAKEVAGKKAYDDEKKK